LVWKVRYGETVGAYEAQTHLPKLLEGVMKGERMLITKHGVPVAVLQAPDPEKTVASKSVVAERHELRDRHTLDGLELSEK
jgi:prevent-host-death family protein